jgi:putative endonuclease
LRHFKYAFAKATAEKSAFTKVSADKAGCSAARSRSAVAERGSTKNIRIRDSLFFGISASGQRMSYYVYILESIKTKKYYIGQTEDLESRLKRHNNGSNKSTKSGAPWELKCWKMHKTRSEAVQEEMKLKGIKKRKGIENYVVENNFRGLAHLVWLFCLFKIFFGV